MNERAMSRVLLAVIALAAGALGELLSPALFDYGASADGVTVFQTLFIGLFLLGFYMALGEILSGTGVTQSPSVPTPESASAETPSAEAFQVRLEKRPTSHTIALLVIAMTALVFVLYLATEYVSYDLPVDYTVTILRVTSLLAGVLLGGVTVCLRIAKVIHYHTMVKACSVILILTALSWVSIERTAYAMLLEVLGYLELSDYVALARLSSVNLLVYVSITWLGLVPAMYFFRPRGHKQDRALPFVRRA